MARKDLFSINFEHILYLLKNKVYMTNEDLHSVHDSAKKMKYISSGLSFSEFHLKLIKNGLIQHSVKIKDRVYIRYSMYKDADLNIYEFTSTFDESRRFFSMSTSLNIQGLSNFRNNIIFLTKERVTKNILDEDNLTQEKIDQAFKKPYRRTKAIGKFLNYNIVLLEANKTNGKPFEVIEYNNYKVSSINRAFVEMISSVGYMRSTEDIINVFVPIKDKLDLNKILKVIKTFDFVYPYYQLAGFYLEQIGYTKNELKSFYKNLSEFNFYAQKERENYIFDEYWKIYH